VASLVVLLGVTLLLILPRIRGAAPGGPGDAARASTQGAGRASHEAVPADDGDQDEPEDPQEPRDPERSGARFHRSSRADEDAGPGAGADTASLEAIGYAAGSMSGRGAAGVTVFERELASPGLNFGNDGHAPEAFLMDMEGRILHRWACPIERAFPRRELPQDATDYGYFRRVHLFPNGDLLGIFEGQGMVKLDRDSRILWTYRARPHHDVRVMDDGRIYVLTRRQEDAPRLSKKRPILHDSIDVLTPDGELERRVSLVEALERSRFDNLLPRLEDGGDLFHTNSLRILDGRLADRSPAFAAGNALVSFFTLNMVAVVDMQSGVLTWALSDAWFHQHDATLLENGNLLVFDNGRQGFSRVWEIEPLTQEVVWCYGGPDVDFYSHTCGLAQRLANGNTLITETDQGRAFEVTPAKRIVWEFHTPYRAGDQGELIASLFRVERLPPDFPADWARGAAAPEVGAEER